MFNPLMAQMLALRSFPFGIPITVQPTAPSRQVSPCQVLSAADLQQLIATRTVPLLGPLNAVPGVRASLQNVTVNCTDGSAVIQLQVSFIAGGAIFRGIIRIFTFLEPIAPLTATTIASPICLRVVQRFFDLVSMPLEIQQRIEDATRTIFSRTICLSGAPTVRQA